MDAALSLAITFFTRRPVWLRGQAEEKKAHSRIQTAVE